MSEYRRIRAVARLVQDRGMTREDADIIALALIPLDEGPKGAPSSRRFAARLARRTQRFRKNAKAAAVGDLVDLARDTIEDYCDLAVVYGEDYYIAIFEEATAGPAPWVARAGASEPEDPPDPTGVAGDRHETRQHTGTEQR